MLSPYLPRLTSLKIRFYDADMILEFMAVLGRYLLRCGRGHFKKLVMIPALRSGVEYGEEEEGPMPESFLEAVRAGALAGLEGHSIGFCRLEDEDAFIQALIDGGGCPRIKGWSCWPAPTRVSRTSAYSGTERTRSAPCSPPASWRAGSRGSDG